jgi:hypothetical protein
MLPRRPNCGIPAAERNANRRLSSELHRLNRWCRPHSPPERGRLVASYLPATRSGQPVERGERQIEQGGRQVAAWQMLLAIHGNTHRGAPFSPACLIILVVACALVPLCHPVLAIIPDRPLTQA